MASFTAGTTFVDGVSNDVTAAKLGALVTNATPTSGFIQDRTAETVVGTDDTILIGDASDSNNLKRMTVANILKAPLASTSGTIDSLTTGTTTSTAQVVTSGTIATLNSTTGTVTNLNSTSGTVATLNSTTGTIANLNSTTGTIATFNSTTGTIANLNSTTGTVATLNSTTGTITTLNSTTGTIVNLNSTTGTVATLNSTTGTIQSLTSSTASVSDIVTTKNIAINVTTLATASGTQNLDLTSQGYLTHSITGNITYTASNYAAGRSLSIRITCDGTQRNLTFPAAWVFVGSKPTAIAASKIGILSITSFGATEADTVAAYAVQA